MERGDREGMQGREGERGRGKKEGEGKGMRGREGAEERMEERTEGNKREQWKEV